MSALRPPEATHLGPEHLGIRVLRIEQTAPDHHTLTIVVPDTLCGPPDVLQGGFCAGVVLAAARVVDPFGAPPTSVEIRLRRPTPLARPLTIEVQRVEAAEYDVVMRDPQDTPEKPLVTGRVSLAGQDPPSGVGELRELAQVALPSEVVTSADFATCVVCGPDNPVGFHLLPAFHHGDVVIGWLPDADVADDRGQVDPTVVCAVLDCPTAWANPIFTAGGAVALLAGYRVVFHAPAPVIDPLRTVAVGDGPTVSGARSFTGRAGLVDEDGVVYATSHATWVIVEALPDATTT